ncbi:hypothetical protein ACTWJ8_40340 (plasmid) [Streptomyces sp. SDT5-1]|uniref:hypothetical protein n=1 Tax=Streptomyces sp. SDT5-1 TaxID=3406418 RepID=UPI003FCF5D33
MAHSSEGLGYHAYIRTEKDEENRPVVGWDDEGYALVVDWETGRRVRAIEVEGFHALDDATAKREDVCTVLPAQPGWQLRDAKGHVRPIVGWTVNGFGCGDPLVVDTDGCMIVASTNGAKVYEPGHDPLH